MAKIKFDTQTLELMSFFESATGARLKDCFTDSLGILTFVVLEGVAKAIGKGGETFRKLESRLKRKIKIVAYSDDLNQFVVNLLMPLKAKNLGYSEETKILTITPEPESRGYIIGRAASNLRNYESIVKRYFDVKEIKVL